MTANATTTAWASSGTLDDVAETLRGADRILILTHAKPDGDAVGSTLALAYAQAHPGRCAGLILRGIFLAEPAEIDWFLYGMRKFFPDAWHHFAGFLPVWDVLFGTFYHPAGKTPQQFGIDEAIPEGFWAQLFSPFRAQPTRLDGFGSRTRSES